MDVTASPQQPGHEAAKYERPYRGESAGRRPEPEIRRRPTFAEWATGLFFIAVMMFATAAFGG